MPPEPAPRSGHPVPADHGLFGPASVTWRVMAEPVLWAAAFRALYLQALHPRVMRGTWQHTAFADPGQAWGRFMRTAEFVRVRTYGSLAEVDRAGRRVRKLHASLRGTDYDGTEFRLDEPELLLWVHCAEISSYADIARRAGIPLARGQLDTFVDEQRRAAAVVGLDPAQVPCSVAGLEEYFARMRPRLRATPRGPACAGALGQPGGRARAELAAAAGCPRPQRAGLRRAAPVGAPAVRGPGQPAGRPGRHGHPPGPVRGHQPRPRRPADPARHPGCPG